MKQRFVYIAIGCILTLASYFLFTLGIRHFNPQDASAADDVHGIHRPNLIEVDRELNDVPDDQQIMADLIGRRIHIGSTTWYDLHTMQDYAKFNVVPLKSYKHIIEYRIDIKLILVKNDIELHVAYRETDAGWELASIKNLRRNLHR